MCLKSFNSDEEAGSHLDILQHIEFAVVTDSFPLLGACHGSGTCLANPTPAPKTHLSLG